MSPFLTTLGGGSVRGFGRSFRAALTVAAGSATTWIPQLDSLSMSVRDLNTGPTSYIALSTA